MNGSVQGIEEIRDFRDNIYDVHSRVPSDVVKAGVEDTIKELKQEIVTNIRRTTTAKGGTLNSDTSPYSSGGSNSSDRGGPHISSLDAWNHYHQSNNPHLYVLQVDKDVQDRAWWMERGTRDHGPNGDNPMYFRVGGMFVVMSDAPVDATRAEKFAAEPKQVEGVKGYYYFEAAVDTIVRRKSLSRNIERRWNKVLHEELEL